MITFTDVSGEVLIADGVSTQQAYTGLTLQSTGRSCVRGYAIVLATGSGGSATLSCNGHQVNIGPHSWMKVGPTHERVHRLLPSGKDLKLIVGKLWAAVAGSDFDDDVTGNVAVGIRG